MPNLKVKPKDKVKPYPDEWTFSYKWHDRVDPRFDRGRWDFSRGEGSIAVFHGKPNLTNQTKIGSKITGNKA